MLTWLAAKQGAFSCSFTQQCALPGTEARKVRCGSAIIEHQRAIFPHGPRPCVSTRSFHVLVPSHAHSLTMPFSENLYVCFLMWSKGIPTETSECGEDPWEGDDESQYCLPNAPHQGFQGGHVLPGHAVNAGHGCTWRERRARSLPRLAAGPPPGLAFSGAQQQATRQSHFTVLYERASMWRVTSYTLPYHIHPQNRITGFSIRLQNTYLWYTLLAWHKVCS